MVTMGSSPEPIYKADESPKLSIVCTASNDNHGGDLVKGMGLCFNGI